MQERTDLFLSYARSDNEPLVKRLYKELVQRGWKVWWDRESMPNRALTFTQEIRDAIEHVDRLLLFVGPHAVRSDYVRSEWEHAKLFAKGIVPILCAGEYSLVPEELKVLHTPDFRQPSNFEVGIEELARILAEPLQELGPLLTAVPALPPHFLHRHDQLNGIRDALLADAYRPIVITSARQTAALQGMGGIGKSVLAAAFARTVETRRAFVDGVLWLTIGQSPDLLQTIRLVALAFGESSENYIDIEFAKARLPRLLDGRVCLIVLDDVWRLDDALPFRNALGPRSRLLVTTRDNGLVTALGAQEQSLGVLTDDQALALLADWSDRPVTMLPPEARDVARECGNLPLALALSGAQARDGTSWSDLREALQQSDLEFLDHPHGSIMRSLKVSVDALPMDHARRYIELAVFPADSAVPEIAVLTLWRHTGNLTQRAGRRTLNLLNRMALLRIEPGTPRLVSLHDLQHDCVCAMTGNLADAHGKLLDAYATEAGGRWSQGPNDGYYFQSIAYHLTEAGRKEELLHLLFDFKWLRTKLMSTDVHNLLADFAYVKEIEAAELLQRGIRLSAHVVALDANQLAGQLMGRMLSKQDDSLIGPLLESVSQDAETNWLKPMQASLTPPGGRLIRTLQGHSDWVNAVAVTPDGFRAISASDDRTVKVWDLLSGIEVLSFEGHQDFVTSVAVTPDGQRAITGSEDQAIEVWDLATGDEVWCLDEHAGGVRAVAVTADGRLAASASEDGTLRLWDLANGLSVCKLEGHAGWVRAVAVMPNCRYAISGSDDQTLKVWDLSNAQTLQTLKGHSSAVSAVAVTPDGRHVVSASEDGTIKVWDFVAGSIIRTMSGHSGRVRAVAVAPDGRRVLSASDDQTVKVWDLTTGQEVFTLTGHSREVYGVAVTPDGQRALSASYDRTVKIWDLRSDESRSDAGNANAHSKAVNAVVVTANGRQAISASTDHTLRVWDLETFHETGTLRGHRGSVSGVALTTDERFVVSSSDDQSLIIWDFDGRSLVRKLKNHPGAVSAVGVTPDGRWIVSVAGTSTLIVWNLKSGRMLRVMDVDGTEVFAMALTPDGRFAVCGFEDETFSVWDISNKRRLRTFVGHTGSVEGVSVTPDGRYVISASGDQTLKLWNLAEGKLLRTFTGHTGLVKAVAVTRDGRRVLSASHDCSLRVWDLATGDCIAAYTSDRALYSCAASSNGEVIVTGDEGGGLHFLRLVETRPRATPKPSKVP